MLTPFAPVAHDVVCLPRPEISQKGHGFAAISGCCAPRQRRSAWMIGLIQCALRHLFSSPAVWRTRWWEAQSGTAHSSLKRRTTWCLEITRSRSCNYANYAAHKHEKARAWLARHPRWTYHFTPTSCSWPNAVEGFFATLDCELLDRHRFRSQAEARIAVFDVTEGWYNPRRRHLAIGYLSPVDYERSKLPLAYPSA